MLRCGTCRDDEQISAIPKISATGDLNYSFALYIISYFVVVNWTLLQVILVALPVKLAVD